MVNTHDIEMDLQILTNAYSMSSVHSTLLGGATLEVAGDMTAVW